MTVALFDVEALAAALEGVDIADGGALDAALARFRAARTAAAATVNILSIALFRVFQVRMAISIPAWLSAFHFRMRLAHL